MRFDLILRIRSGAMLIGPVVSVVLAYMGFSFYSMAWGQAAEQAAVVALTALISPKGFWVRPGLSEWRRVFSFGTKAMISQILDTVSFYITDLILGRMLGFGPVGLYSRAMSLINLFQQRFMEAVNGVVLPAFARANRAEEDLVPPFARAVSCLTGVAWPFYAFAGILAFPVVRVLFGDQWDASVPLVRVLCIGGAIMSVWAISRRVLSATGNINQKLLATLLIQPAFIAAVIFAATQGLMAVTWAYVGMSGLGLMVHYTILRRYVLGTLRPVMVGLARSLGPTVGSLAGPGLAVALWGLEPANPVAALAVAVPVSAAGWLIGLGVARHPLLEEIRHAWTALSWRRLGRGAAAEASPPQN
jgi:O-antigen/teichoic acid export membrane protein